MRTAIFNRRRALPVLKAASRVLATRVVRAAASMQQQDALVEQQQQPTAQPPAAKRRICDGCKRPQRVCLCPALPAQPIRLHGHVVVLQHPHELKEAFATVPLLQRCATPCIVTVGRQLKLDQNLAIKQLLDLTRPQTSTSTATTTATGTTTAAASQAPGNQQKTETSTSLEPPQQAAECTASTNHGPLPLYVLFPGPGALPLSQVAALPSHVQRMQRSAAARLSSAPARVSSTQGNGQQQQQEQQQQQQQQQGLEQVQHQAAGEVPSASEQRGLLAGGDGAVEAVEPAYVLLVVDGSWTQAKEMFNALKRDYLAQHGTAQLVLLPADPPPAEMAQPADEGSEPAGEGSHGEGNVPTHAVVSEKACLIKKEPVEGYMTTYEAVSRALTLLEGPQQPPDMLDTLLAPLRLWTKHQAQFDQCTRDRISGKREADSEWVRSREATKAARAKAKAEANAQV